MSSGSRMPLLEEVADQLRVLDDALTSRRENGE